MSEPRRSTRQNLASGRRWEPIVGYSRAVRVGNRSTSPAPPPPTPRAHRRRRRRLRADPSDAEEHRGGARSAGRALADVVRTRIYVTDIADWEAIGRAHGEVFGAIRPATAWSRSRA